jgi:hypothetical protein
MQFNKTIETTKQLVDKRKHASRLTLLENHVEMRQIRIKTTNRLELT